MRKARETDIISRMKKLLKNNLVIDLVILFLITIFLLTYFQPQLLFLRTTINGGDTGSHYPAAVYLKEVLLPQGKIMGWDQGNYAGYPLFYHYFPLPFILMGLISFLLPMQISFKLITVLGVFLLPLFTYLSFRFMRYDFPIPIFAAICSLPFLFNQGNSMWGANIPSMMAGEFCYSLGFALVFLFMGSLYYGVREKKLLIFNAWLVFLIGFSHAYALIFCLMIGSFFVFDDFKKNFFYLFGVYGLGFCLLSFWLLPVLGTLPYVTSFVFRWTIHSLLEVFVPVMIPLMVFSLIGFVLNLKDKRTMYFIYLILFCVFVYLVGPRIGVLDIRFVPFFQFLLVVFAATAIIKFLPEIKLVVLLPLIVFIAVVVWTDLNTTYIHSWIKWNYSGYEQKKTWSTFKGINDYLRQAGGGRVEWEHTPKDEALGSIRSSETLPYFAKRQTLEGIHMLGAISAPFVFYIESETSYQACNPIPNYFYSTLDLKRGIDHFELFNVDHFVVRSPQVKQLIRQYPQFKLEKTVAEYEIHRLLSNINEYVVPLKNQPVLFLGGEWRNVAYRWFATEKLKDTFLVFKKQSSQADQNQFSQTITALADLKTVPYANQVVKVKSKINPESIEIETSKIGHPLLIKVSYHPNWRVKGAERVYLVSPSFMLIFPTEHHVYLSFEPGLLAKVGKSLTLFGIIGPGLVLFWRRRYGSA